MKVDGRRACIVLLAAALVGCSSGTGAGAPAPGRDAAAGDGAVDAVMAVDAGDDAPASLRPPQSGLPLPAGGPQPHRFLAGGAELTGQGLSSCSHQEPPSADGH